MTRPHMKTITLRLRTECFVRAAFASAETAANTVAGVILQGAAVLGYLLAEGLTDAAAAAKDER